MGWEKRGNRIYYYKKRRVGKKVISEYFGNGILAEETEIIDSMKRIENMEKREQVKKARVNIQTMQSELNIGLQSFS